MHALRVAAAAESSKGKADNVVQVDTMRIFMRIYKHLISSYTHISDGQVNKILQVYDTILLRTNG